MDLLSGGSGLLSSIVGNGLLVWILLAGVFAVLWILSKIPGTRRLAERGLLNIGASWLGAGIGRVGRELLGVVWLLFGRGTDEGDDSEGTWNEKTIRRMVGVAISIDLVLVVLSFMGSFTASRAYAIDHGISEAVAFAVPLTVDGGILLSVIVIFVMALARSEARKARISLGVLTCVSILFNVAHISDAQGASFAIVLLGMIFPAVLFGGTELMVDLIKTQMTRSGTIQTIDELRESRERLMASCEQLRAEISGQDIVIEKPEVSAAMLTETITTATGGDIVSLLREGTKTYDELIKASGKGTQYVKRVARHLMREGRIVYDNKTGLFGIGGGDSVEIFSFEGNEGNEGNDFNGKVVSSV